MPKLDIDMFDESPKVGDRIKVLGKIKSIDEDTGDVEASYDEVKIIPPKKRKRSSDRDDDDDDTVPMDVVYTRDDRSLDDALNQAFPPTQ